MNTDPILYYSKRAKEYEQIYQKPERQEDLQKLRVMVKNIFSGHSVLEVACGTGYWTQCMSETAQSILAMDINKSVIEIAKAKKYSASVNFQIADIYNLPKVNKNFDAGFGGFIWSHIPKQILINFLSQFISKIALNGTLTFIDSQYIEGYSTPIDSSDEFGNTYQIRTLSDGSYHKVMKNFPSDAEIINAIDTLGTDIEIKRSDYFWILKFNAKKTGDL